MVINQDFLVHIGYIFAVISGVMFGASGAGFGQGVAAGFATAATTRQALAEKPVMRMLFVGLAFVESGAILSLLLAILMLLKVKTAITLAQVLAYLGAGLGMGISAAVVGIASGFVLQGAMLSIGRQPLSGAKIMTLTLVTQALLEAPVVFQYLIGMIIYMQVSPEITLAKGVQLMGSGLVLAGGSIGAAFGQATFAQSFCTAVGIDINSYSRIFSFAMITQALIETPVIFSFMVAFLFMSFDGSVVPLPLLAGVIAAIIIAMSLGGAGASGGSGIVGANAAISMARQPQHFGALFQNAFFCQAIIDSAIVYTLVISFMLMQTFIWGAA